ncbi:retrovirus-related Pol polyprotein from type-1 retrotransposable element R2 [Elysia marginata]|uniref:Retrovirus-related Pol polyprotein from type-1 retrotransposable element R2 n=1 Tax=Elysia marginata TaxID=1093978 RepID=A0AAV4F6G0_9GAST|nr:retrovirus-related Pol polyprotein from type-1 retrotransposable element R2 [Elysia marginata]
MSALLFSIAIDWVMRQTTEDQNRGIRWNLFTNLEDLDFADDLALLSHTHHHIQEKTGRLNTYAKQIGLKISKKKTEDLSKLSSFHTKNLRKIARIFWPQRISNEELLEVEHCQQESIEKILVERRWKWIGHALCKSQNAIPRVAVQWKPEGRRKRGRPKSTWRRTAEAEAATMGESWGTLRTLAQDHKPQPIKRKVS